MLTFIVAIALVALIGCASLPSPGVMKAEVASYPLRKLPEPTHAICYVIHPPILGDRIGFNVLVDNE